MSLIKYSIHFEDLVKTMDLSSLEGGRILVCGGTGLIGSYLTAALARGCSNQGVSLNGPITITGRRSNHYLKLLQSKGLIRIRSLDSILAKETEEMFTHVFHAASPASPDRFKERNILRFLNYDILPILLGKTSKVFIYFSTGEVYGVQAPLGVSENYRGVITDSVDRSAYPTSKLLGEQRLNELSNESACEIKIVRFFHTFGPGVSKSDSRAFASFLYEALKTREVHLNSDGRQIRSFLHLADTVRALFFFIQDPNRIKLDVVNVGSSNPVSMIAFANAVSELTNSKLVINSTSSFELSPNEILVPNTSKLKKTGWRQEVDLTETINDTLTWMKLSSTNQQY